MLPNYLFQIKIFNYRILSRFPVRKDEYSMELVKAAFMFEVTVALKIDVMTLFSSLNDVIFCTSPIRSVFLPISLKKNINNNSFIDKV